MTIDAFAQSLMAEMDEATDNTDYLAVVKGWVEDACDEIASIHEWKLFRRTLTLNTVGGTATYQLPENIREIRAMRLKVTNEPIEYLDAPVLYSMAEDLENTGKPQYWWWESSAFVTNDVFLKIQLDPVPDAIYTVEYLGVLHPLSAVTANVNIPYQRQMFLAIKNRVRAYMLQSDKDYEGASIARQDFLGILKELIDDENAKMANDIRLQPRDISNQRDRRLAKLDPNHF